VTIIKLVEAGVTRVVMPRKAAAGSAPAACSPRFRAQRGCSYWFVLSDPGNRIIAMCIREQAARDIVSALHAANNASDPSVR
jgi:hypothetical protein